MKSKEDRRHQEIKMRLENLRAAKLVTEEFHQLAKIKMQRLVDEILNLEDELECIRQGQLFLD